MKPRANVHDVHIRFRVNHAIVAAAEEKSRREGMSLSELMRHALRTVVKDAA